MNYQVINGSMNIKALRNKIIKESIITKRRTGY